jgi:hypothetical protein
VSSTLLGVNAGSRDVSRDVPDDDPDIHAAIVASSAKEGD